MTRDEIIAANPLPDFLEGRGVTLSQGKRRANKCPAKEHTRKDTVSIDPDKNVWMCHACGTSGTILDWVMQAEGIDFKEAYKRMGGNGSEPVNQPAPRAAPSSKGRIASLYSYEDENGNELFQCVRYEPKDFRQRHRGEDGEWKWTLDGVRRVLYKLPSLIEADEVAITEGEKDVETAVSLGLPATCNPMGALKWLDSYSEFLRDKHVIVFPDNDARGLEHAEAVIKSLMGKAKTIRKAVIPSPHKDLTEYVASFPTKEDASEAVIALCAGAKFLRPGYDLPLKDMVELEYEYQQTVRTQSQYSLALDRWLPGLRRTVRPLVPGELMVVLAATGVGKTCIAQHILMYGNLPSILFELELPGSLLFERFVAMTSDMPARDVEAFYLGGNKLNFEKSDAPLKNVLVCDKSGLTVEELGALIEKADVKLGCRPKLIVVDYVGLLSAPGTSRYERMSHAAEQLKVLAKQSDTIVVMIAQISRPGEEKEPGLHSGKDSGSIENSAGLVIGAWRPEDQLSTINMKVLKATKGGSGTMIVCNFNLETLRITERFPEQRSQHSSN